MKVKKRIDGDIAVVDVVGDVDMYTSPKLRDALQSLTRGKVQRIIVNLAGVEFMDSSGIATIVQAYKEILPKNGSVCLASPAGNVLRVFELSNLTSLFPVYDSVDEAREG